MSVLSRISHLGGAVESVHGTHVAPTFWLPSMEPKLKDRIEPLRDESIRGNFTVLQGLHQGPSSGEHEWSGNAYPDTFGHILAMAFGPSVTTAGVSTTLAADATAGASQISTTDDIPAGTTILIGGTTPETRITAASSGTGPFTIPFAAGQPTLAATHASASPVTGNSSHLFKVANAQPPSYSFTWFDGVETRGYPGCRISELKLKIDAKGFVSYEISVIGWPSVTDSTPTPVWTDVAPLLGWQWTMTSGGQPSTRGLELELTIKRETEALHASTGSRNPREVFAPGVEFDGKLTAIFDTTDDRDLFLTGEQSPLTVLLTQPSTAGGAELELTASKSAWHSNEPDYGDAYAKLELEISGVYSTTDGGPVQATLRNQVTTGYGV